MKIRKLFMGIFVFSGLAGLGMAQETPSPDSGFLQEIQDRLSKASGLKNHPVTLRLTADQKRIIRISPSSISFSYGFLRQMENIQQVIATMAHMTAHISLDFIETPPLPENHKARKKSGIEAYITAAVRPDYPDENYLPQATGALYNKGAVMPERAGYQNSNYDFAVNKKDIITAEQEREADRIVLKILKHSGFCPTDYHHMLRYFYEHPQKLPGNEHFALEAEQWQRLDMLEQLSPRTKSCSQSQKALAQKYTDPFAQLRVKIIQTLKTGG